MRVLHIAVHMGAQRYPPSSTSPSNRHHTAPSANVPGLMPMVLPKLGYIQIIVSEVVDPAHFWAQRVDTSVAVQLQSMMDAINAESDRLIPLLSSPEDLVGHMCVAPYSENGQYYRAKVQSIAPSTGLVMVRKGAGREKVATYTNLGRRKGRVRDHTLLGGLWMD